MQAQGEAAHAQAELTRLMEQYQDSKDVLGTVEADLGREREAMRQIMEARKGEAQAWEERKRMVETQAKASEQGMQRVVHQKAQATAEAENGLALEKEAHFKAKAELAELARKNVELHKARM